VAMKEGFDALDVLGLSAGILGWLLCVYGPQVCIFISA